MGEPCHNVVSRIPVAAVMSSSLAGRSGGRGDERGDDTGHDVASTGGPVGVIATRLGENSDRSAGPASTGSPTTPDTAVRARAPRRRTDSAEVRRFLPPDEPWGGLTRGEWDARSMAMGSLSFPEDINPWGDTTGRTLRIRAVRASVLPFDTGRETRITCVVAEGTAIWVNVANIECATIEPTPFFGRTEEELRACATEHIDGVTDYQARVNGRMSPNLDAYRTASPLFTLTTRKTTSSRSSRA